MLTAFQHFANLQFHTMFVVTATKTEEFEVEEKSLKTLKIVLFVACATLETVRELFSTPRDLPEIQTFPPLFKPPPPIPFLQSNWEPCGSVPSRTIPQWQLLQ